MGRLMMSEMEREGVEKRGIVKDNERMKEIVIMGIRDKKNLKIILYREKWEEMEIWEEDIEKDLIEEESCVIEKGKNM